MRMSSLFIYLLLILCPIVSLQVGNCSRLRNGRDDRDGRKRGATLGPGLMFCWKVCECELATKVSADDKVSCFTSLRIVSLLGGDPAYVCIVLHVFVMCMCVRGICMYICGMCTRVCAACMSACAAYICVCDMCMRV